MSAYLDPMEKMHIDFAAASMAHAENPDYEGRLIDIVTEDHIKAALKVMFKDCDNYSDDLLPDLLACYKRTESVERRVRNFAQSVMRGMVGGLLP